MASTSHGNKQMNKLNFSIGMAIGFIIGYWIGGVSFLWAAMEKI